MVKTGFVGLKNEKQKEGNVKKNDKKEDQMKNIEIQRPGFDKIGVVFVGINQGEQLVESFREIKLQNGKKRQHQ